jgi:hypothetical protein
MSLKSVQTYEVNGNGVLDPVNGLVFNTDTSGTVVLGGRDNNVDYTSFTPNLRFNGDGSYAGPYTDYGTSTVIGGGISNATIDGQASFIGAGQGNYISGETQVLFQVGNPYPIGQYFTSNFGAKSFIGAGTLNKICSPKSAIIGGHGNQIIGTTLYYGSYIQDYPRDEYQDYSIPFGPNSGYVLRVDFGPGYNVIAGGKNNYLNGVYSIIGGGEANRITSDRRSIINPGSYYGYESQLSGQYNFIGGGCNNTVANTCTSSIVGGRNNLVSLSDDSSLVGGSQNLISGLSEGNSLVGGVCNRILGGSYQFMGGGLFNIISGSSCSSLLGGADNSIVSNNVIGRSADKLNIIAGGCQNLIFGGCSSIIGGSDNAILNTICSSIIGGSNSTITARCATILGGKCIVVSHTGAVMIGDHTSRIKNSVGKDTLTFDFVSGTYIKNKIIFQSDDYIPSSSTSFGISGQIAYDSNYHYRHDGNKWKRTALAEF